MLNKKMFLLSRFLLKTRNLLVSPRNRLHQSTSTKNIEADTGPIKYSVSPASRWRAETSRKGVRTERLWYEPYVIVSSLSVFMVYFCLLRQENDIDVDLQKTLYNRIKGLEEHQLKISLEYNAQHGMETQNIIDRLKELKEKEE